MPPADNNRAALLGDLVLMARHIRRCFVAKGCAGPDWAHVTVATLAEGIEHSGAQWRNDDVTVGSTEALSSG